jgi:hypothetical protein
MTRYRKGTRTSTLPRGTGCEGKWQASSEKRGEDGNSLEVALTGQRLPPRIAAARDSYESHCPSELHVSSAGDN